MSKNPVKMWVDPEFRKLLYEKKAENPDRTLQQISKDIAISLRYQKKNEKKKEFFKFPRF